MLKVLFGTELNVFFSCMTYFHVHTCLCSFLTNRLSRLEKKRINVLYIQVRRNWPQSFAEASAAVAQPSSDSGNSSREGSRPVSSHWPMPARGVLLVI